MFEPDYAFSKFLIDRCFKDKDGNVTKNGTVIECGALNGLWGSVSWVFTQDHGWSGVNIECNEHCFDQLKKNRPGCKNYCFALSDKNKKAILYTPINEQKSKMPAGCAIEKIPYWKGKYEHWENEVRTVTYSKMIRIAGLKTVDLFILDIEGHESTVLESIKNCSIKPRVMCIEDDHCDTQKMFRQMIEMGYERGDRHVNNTLFVMRGNEEKNDE